MQSPRGSRLPQRVVPLLAPRLRKSLSDEMSCYETKARGMAVLTTPLLNKGSAFTTEEREALGLTGLLPPVISTLEAQVMCAYAQYQRLPDALGKNIYLTALHDRNEVLFFRLLSEHLREMIPIVNDRTVGLAMEQYHHECRRPRGVYLSIDHADAIEEAFQNLKSGPGDIDLILATDAEQIFGLGDWGVGGIEISIGKLAIYTAAGGIDPTRVIPVMLDVGTNRESLLADPMYPGNRHGRVRGVTPSGASNRSPFARADGKCRGPWGLRHRHRDNRPRRAKPNGRSDGLIDAFDLLHGSVGKSDTKKIVFALRTNDQPAQRINWLSKSTNLFRNVGGM